MNAEMPQDLTNAIAEAIDYCRANVSRGNLAYALAYLDAMDRAIAEHGPRVIPVQLLYVLNNLSAWKGEDARRVKAVLKSYARTA
jgi:hypothetical protein